MVGQSFLESGAQKWMTAQRWGMNKFALGSGNYWFTFVADASSALFFLIWTFLQGSRPVTVVLSAVVGYLLWGLSEYVFHRWIYHQPEGIFGEGHRIHHEKDQVLIAMPWFMTTGAVFALWYLISVKLALPLFSASLAGWLAGFVWYSLVHHSHHHWSLNGPVMRRLKAYHRVHHQFPEFNYGVTMRFWDAVFGTRYKRSASEPHHS